MTTDTDRPDDDRTPSDNLPIPVTDPVADPAKLIDLVEEYSFPQTPAQWDQRRDVIGRLARSGRSHSPLCPQPDENIDIAIRRRIKLLKDARIEQGLSATEVALRIGVDKSVVSKFENGSTDPRMSTMLRYAIAVGMDVQITR